ncbi:hypothetical protein PRV_01840 [Mycoplasma parvum str. Indiana]|uniref:Uncharacterized protein n=1 Tax=Mycoplasma parvum str. Indiana TaxID=1403316 RepID=U5NG02_9MOLU|nr:hypothetical protein PRV_01840 [Mycoplasma parvum str. Indiana]
MIKSIFFLWRYSFHASELNQIFNFCNFFILKRNELQNWFYFYK